jgi:hypothetical protein
MDQGRVLVGEIKKLQGALQKTEMDFGNERTLLRTEINDKETETEAFRTICVTKDRERQKKMDEYFKKSFEKDKTIRTLKQENT